MARAYCTAADVRALGVCQLADHDIEGLIEAATVRIEQETRRVFEAVGPEVRTFECIRDEYCLIDDALSITAVSHEDAALTADDWKAYPPGSKSPKWALKDLVGTWLAGDEMDVTATWGYSSTPPADIKEACAVWVLRMAKQADAGFEDATAIPELGQLVFNRAIPEHVRTVIERYRRVTPV